MEVEGLSVVCAGLGCSAEDEVGHGFRYVRSDNCLENLKDLQRFLRRDHPKSRDVFKQLGKWNTVAQDLVPIILHCRNDHDLVINAVKVVVFLTMPLNPSSDDIPQQKEYLLKFRASFVDNDAIAVIVTLLEEPLEHLESGVFLEDDWKIVQLVLTLFRNLLDTQDPLPCKSIIDTNSQHFDTKDKLLEVLFEENVMDLLLVLAHHVSGPHRLLQHDNLLLVEILHHIFWDQRPEAIAAADSRNAKVKCSDRSSGLRALMEEEKEQLKMTRLRDLPRHSRFSGMFVKVAEDGSKKILKRNPFQSFLETVLKGPRFKHGPVKRIAPDMKVSFTPKEKVLGLLKAFADQILSGGYNVLMQSVKEDIGRERAGIQTADTILFFWVAKFFTSYQRNRVSSFKETISSQSSKADILESRSVFQGQLCGPIATTMDEIMFNMVLSKWYSFIDLAKETNDCVSLTMTGALMKEMICMLDLVLRSSKNTSTEGKQEMRVARIIIYKIFYDYTEKGILQLLRHLIKSFDIHKQPRSHLSDLVETVHVVLHLIEYLTEADGTLRVSKKARKVRKKQSKGLNTDSASVAEPEDTGENNGNPDVFEKHETNADGVSHISGSRSLAHEVSDSGKHFDTSYMGGGSIDEPTTYENIDITKHFETPSLDENLNYGGENKQDTVKTAKTCEVQTRVKDGINEATHHENFQYDEDEMNEEESQCLVEVSLDVQRCVSSFADNTIVRNYSWLLKYFNVNLPETNHYIIQMFQRICNQCTLEPIFYQLSLLCVFYGILTDKNALKPEHKNIVDFLTKLIRHFFKKLKAQPLLFIEILFWRTKKECHFMDSNFLIQKLGKSFHNKIKGRMSAIADSLGDDEFDSVQPFGELNHSTSIGSEMVRVQIFDDKASGLKNDTAAVDMKKSKRNLRKVSEMRKKKSKGVKALEEETPDDLLAQNETTASTQKKPKRRKITSKTDNAPDDENIDDLLAMNKVGKSRQNNVKRRKKAASKAEKAAEEETLDLFTNRNEATTSTQLKPKRKRKVASKAEIQQDDETIQHLFLNNRKVESGKQIHEIGYGRKGGLKKTVRGKRTLVKNTEKHGGLGAEWKEKGEPAAEGDSDQELLQDLLVKSQARIYNKGISMNQTRVEHVDKTRRVKKAREMEKDTDDETLQDLLVSSGLRHKLRNGDLKKQMNDVSKETQSSQISSLGEKPAANELDFERMDGKIEMFEEDLDTITLEAHSAPVMLDGLRKNKHRVLQKTSDRISWHNNDESENINISVDDVDYYLEDENAVSAIGESIHAKETLDGGNTSDLEEEDENELLNLRSISVSGKRRRNLVVEDDADDD